MKVKLVFFEMETSTTNAADSLSEALTAVLDAAFPAEPRVEVHCADSALSAHETKEG